MAAIRQRIDLAIRTTRGTDPLRPEMGTYIYRYTDMPVNRAVPNIKKEILEAIGLWVPEVKVVSIIHSFESPSNPVFFITVSLRDEDLIDKLVFSLQAGVTSPEDSLNEIILQAFFPLNPNNLRYQIKLIKNGAEVFPMPNPSGYATIQDLFNWINDNWFFMGRWYLLADKIICYMNSTGIVSASLAISVLYIVRFESVFPSLLDDEYYSVEFVVNGSPVLPAMPQYNNPGAVLAFAQSQWSHVATWGIEYLQDDGSGIFSDAFSDAFAVSAVGYKLVGVSNAPGFNPSLQILIN